MSLVLKEAIPDYAAGAHTVDFGITRNRYEVQLVKLANIINGEMATPYTYEHAFLAQEGVLAAAGYTEWKE